MNKEAVLINLEDWYAFGGGFTAESFYCKSDDNVMMKLYQNFMPADEGLRELEVSEHVAQLGLPTAKAIQFVKTADRYGAVFERIKNKRSIARILGDEPQRVDEMAKLFADMCKKLHSTKCNQDYFQDLQKRIVKTVMQSPFINEGQKENALALIANTPKADTCLHGDLHMGNVIIAEGKEPMFIDLSDFAYGNPLFDLGMGYFTAHYITDERCFDLYHIHSDLMAEFWKLYLGYYFGSRDIADIETQIKPYAGLQAIYFARKSGGLDAELTAAVEAAFGK